MSTLDVEPRRVVSLLDGPLHEALAADQRVLQHERRPDIDFGPLAKDRERGLADPGARARYPPAPRSFRNKQELQRIILERKITIVFQPIWDLNAKIPHGFEALCRGPADTEFRSPLALFDCCPKG